MSADSIATGLRCVRRGRRCLQWALLTLLALGLSLILGCQSISNLSAAKTPWSMLANRDRKATDENRPSIEGIKGPTERKLAQAAWEQAQRDAAAAGDTGRIAGFAEYQAAERLFNAGRYREAEKAFKQLAKDRQDRGLSFTERAFEALRSGTSASTENKLGDPVEEDALFMVAECQFNQKKYSRAQDSYDALLERYPSSRHLDKVTRRLFRIAQSWMGFPQVNEDNNVQLASAELQDTNPRTGDRSFQRPSFINLTDPSRPVFDTAGRALQALQSIWLHDANGPLADDALMLTANYHLQTGDFVEAARVYQLLREQYPDSPHFKDAYLLDSHVRLASYEGAAYDDKALEQSRELRKTAQRLFPNMSPEQKERLQKELERIHLSKVERVWHKVRFYQSKGDEAAVALYCNKILNLYPDTPFAESAQRVLAEIADQHRQPRSGPLGFLTGSDEPIDSPVLEGIVAPAGSLRQRQAAGKDAAAPAGSPDISDAASSPSTSSDQPGFLRRMLTPVGRPPNLQRIDPEPAAEPFYQRSGAPTP